MAWQDRQLHMLERLGTYYSQAQTGDRAIASSWLWMAIAKISIACSCGATQQRGVRQLSKRPTSPAGGVCIGTYTWPLLLKRPCSTSSWCSNQCR